ncbi:MAG: putative Ig domain-containing protein [Janthinobacterium lividum]
MRHRLLLLLLLLLPAWTAWAQAPAWQSVVTSTATIVRGSAVSASGDYYVVGSYTGTATFGSTTLTSAGGSQDYFLAKLSGSTNTWVWAVSGIGSSGTDDARGVAVSGSTVYVTGTYDGSLTVGGSTLTSAGGQDVFVAKYTDGGTSVTANSALSGGGTGADQSFAIAVNGTNIYVTGFVNTNTTATTNVKFGTVSLGNNGDEDLFVARFTDTGTLAYGGAVSSGGIGVDRGLAIGVSGTGIYVTGFFTGTTAVSISNSSLTGAGGMDMFLAKYTDTGSGLGTGGAVKGGGSANDQGQALTISGSSIYVGGTFNTTASIAGSSLTSASTTLPDIFVAKYADTGSGLSNSFAVRDGGANTEAVGSILVSSGSVYVAGAYTGTTTLAGTSLTSSSDDGFVAKYTDGTSTLTSAGAIHNGATAAGASVSANTTLAVSNGQVYVGGLVATPATFTSTSTSTLTASSGSAFVAKLAQNVTVVSITGITPSPTATTQVTYQVVFSGAVTGLGINNFDLTTTGLSGTGISGVSGSGTTYTVTVNTGTSNGTLRLNVQNSTGTSPTITGLPTTTGTTYTITRSFAAAPQLTIVGTGGTGSDVTAFVDQVQVLSSSSVFANGLQNSSFETHNPYNNGGNTFAYNPTGAAWTFNAQAGIADQGSAFTPVTPIPNGISVAFVQSNGNGNGQLQQNLAVPTGSNYQVSFQAAQRVCCTTLDQALNVFLNGVYLGISQPNSNGYTSFTSPTFAVAAPALTASVSTTSASTTSTSPIPFAVSFSQSVGTTFTAADVTVAGGTLTSGSFSGSGSGPYTFTVTPSASGTVAVSLAANVANDANNTGNAASNTVSVQYTQPVTAAPVITLPANNTVTNQTVTISGTAPANSTVVLYRSFNGGTPQATTLTATAGGAFTTGALSLPDGTYTVYATAQSAGASVSANSATITFTVDTTRPTVVLTNPSPSGSTNVASPFAFTATFSEAVTGFVAGDLALTNGTVSAFSGSGTTYTFTVTPNTLAIVTTVAVFANSSQDAAGNGNMGSGTYSLTSAPPTIVVSPVSLSGGTVGTAYSQTITASGGIAPYTFAITAGALPAGLALTSGGVLAGTPTAGGSFTFTVTATDNSAAPGPYSGARSYTLAIGAPTITVAPTTLPGGTVGTAYSQTVTASGGTAPYSFSITSGALPTGLALSTSGVLLGTPTVAGSYTFTVTARDASTGTGAPYSGSLSYTVAIADPTNVTWNGTISTDWFTAGNWTPAVVPTATINALIPAGTAFSPFIGSTTATALGLTLNSGATLNMSGGTLDVRANLTSNGTFLPTGGTVVLGTTAQSNGPNILGSSRVRFWNLTVNANGVQLSTSAGASVRRLLTLNGAFVTQANDFVLESDATGTALVVNSNSAGFVSGSATVQRYIDASGNTGTSGYRHYSSPVGGATVNSLSTSAYGGSFTAQVNTLYNTADPNQLTLATYPNVFGYDESKIAASPAVSFSDFDKGYQSPASLGTSLTVGRGYAVQIGNTEKVQFTGPLNNNTQNIGGLTYAAASTAGSASAGWALIGNPYPAPLDWSTVGTAAGSSLNGVDGAAYVFQSTSAYSGRYTSFTNNVGAGTGLIASGQGFFVRASTPGTTGSVTLTNANRVTSYANPAFQRTTAETRPLLRLSLGLGNQPATVATAQDETFLYFEAGATNGYDGQFDAYKLANPSGYYLGSVTPGSTPLGLSIDGRSPLAAATVTEIPLWVSLPAGTYTLTATELLNFATLAGGTQVQLRDALLGTLTDLATVPSYSFNVAANAAYAGRFSLVFRTSGVLATASATLAQATASLYPNPATSATALSVTGLPAAVTSLQVEVVDVLGRAVGHYTLPVRSGSAYQRLATEQLASTLYLLRLTALDAQGQVQGTLPTQRLTLAH